MTERDKDVERAQRLVCERFGEGRSPSDELIRERREEAAREEREFADLGPFDPEAVRRRLVEFEREPRGER